MAGESKGATEDQVESLIDELMGKIFSEPGRPGDRSMHGVATTAALFEAAFGSTRAASRTSVLERVLVAEAFAAELAEALAPALAEQLAPRIMSGLEELLPAGMPGKESTPNGRSSGQSRRAESKLPASGAPAARRR
jgi:hypothetical protein